MLQRGYGLGQPRATPLLRLGSPGAHGKPWPGAIGSSRGELGGAWAAQPCTEVQRRGTIFLCTVGGCFPSLQRGGLFNTQPRHCRHGSALAQDIVGAGSRQGLAVTLCRVPAGVKRFCQDIVDMICWCPPWCSHMLGFFRVCWSFLTPCLLLVSTKRPPGAGGGGRSSSSPSMSPSPPWLWVWSGAAPVPAPSWAFVRLLEAVWGDPAQPRHPGPGSAVASCRSCLLCPPVHAHLHLPGDVQRAPALRLLRVPVLGQEPGRLHGAPQLPAGPTLGRRVPVPRVGDVE